jgi:hypothetical protein
LPGPDGKEKPDADAGLKRLVMVGVLEKDTALIG